MSDDPESRSFKVKVMDKRTRAENQEVEPGAVEAEGGDARFESAAEAQQAAELLDDLRRLQADFDNYRKRVVREQTAMVGRASARLVERLLPVLDNFERAVAHGEGGPGIELVYKELYQVLEQEGLEAIEAEGRPFDPRIHEAFQAVDDPEVEKPVCRSVFRRGYRLGDQVLRPAMVVVARPPEQDGGEEGEAAVADGGEG